MTIEMETTEANDDSQATIFPSRRVLEEMFRFRPAEVTPFGWGPRIIAPDRSSMAT